VPQFFLRLYKITEVIQPKNKIVMKTVFLYMTQKLGSDLAFGIKSFQGVQRCASLLELAL